MLALVATVFGICWLPYRSMVTYNSFVENKWDPDWYVLAYTFCDDYLDE